MIAPDTFADIQQQLTAVEAEEGVRVLFAVESGSRAWGFASADSDYDVRFVYARPADRYLSIDAHQKPDTVERMLPGDIDLSGWDVRKALGLFAKSNPPLIEWLDSPVTYRDDGVFRAELRRLLPTTHSPAACLHHYVRMARRNVDAYLGRPAVKRKKYLYVLRPLLAGRWIEQGRGPVPMPFTDLFVTLGPEHAAVRAAIDELLKAKVAGGELGAAPPVTALDEFIVPELARLEAVAAGMTKTPVDLEPLNALFRRTIGAG